MRTHITIIAWLNILLSIPVLLFGLILMVGFMTTGAMTASLPFLGVLGVFLFFLIALYSIPGLILGWGLLTYAPWARIFGIVVSILNLVAVHSCGLGTLLGIYGLVIFFNPETEALFSNRPRIY